MLLAITTTHVPASDLGFLLAKNPRRTHQFDLAYGRAHVFYPEVSETRCTAALLLEVDPICHATSGEVPVTERRSRRT